MRILRCCHEMGIETVVAYSTEDAESLPVQFSAESVCIGPAPAAKSYLNTDVLLQAAKSTHCDAIHPGYGFLSENAEFAEACEKNGIAFIGPSSQMIRDMGDKQSARALMKAKGVPVVPGSDGLVETAEDAIRVAEKTGYPVLVKASAGGGGRGMRTAYDSAELERAFEDARAEAIAAFGDGSMYLEKLILNPHHIEVQILGDKQGHVVHLGERDCSMQRRHQKLLEESPAWILSDKMRDAMYKAAVRAAKAVHYVSAGTVEFVVDKEGNFYFIEMNTRIQVEHPVTEMETGVDLLREQIRIAAGRELSVKQSQIKLTGHTIECRINAEDPSRNFAPDPGMVSFLHFPGGEGIRVESAIYQGCRISPYYDSMIAKIIVHAPGRLEAIRKMRTALEELTIEGVHTNTNLLYLIMFNSDYMLGNVDTGFMEKQTDAILKWDKESGRTK
ncbi:MAG: acetyl-CoA carboxylase biotin carboxylase subunit [Eubacterium sp.]|nr:acetyl-CoA carboxylase biotin carboxylase subunit [Eubacterium sp.]